MIRRPETAFRCESKPGNATIGDATTLLQPINLGSGRFAKTVESGRFQLTARVGCAKFYQRKIQVVSLLSTISNGKVWGATSNF